MKPILFSLILVSLISSGLAMTEIIVVQDTLTSPSTQTTTSFLLDLGYFRYTLTPVNIDVLSKSCNFTLNGYNFTLYENQGTDFDLNKNNITDWTIYVYKVGNGTIDLTIQNKEKTTPVQKDFSSENRALAISLAIVIGIYLILYRKETSPKKSLL